MVVASVCKLWWSSMAAPESAFKLIVCDEPSLYMTFNKTTGVCTCMG